MAGELRCRCCSTGARRARGARSRRRWCGGAAAAPRRAGRGGRRPAARSPRCWSPALVGDRSSARDVRLHPLVTLLARAGGLVLAVVSSRAAGETDLAPVGAVGTVTQLLFSGYGADPLDGRRRHLDGDLDADRADAVGVQGGAAPEGLAARAGHGADHRRAGRRAGGGAGLPGSSRPTARDRGLPAPAAMSWKATAEAVRGGSRPLPPTRPLAGGDRLAGRRRCCLSARAPPLGERFLPSPAAMGIAVLIPASLSLAALAGRLLAGVVHARCGPSVDQESLTSLAAGRHGRRVGHGGRSSRSLVVTGIFK